MHSNSPDERAKTAAGRAWSARRPPPRIAGADTNHVSARHIVEALEREALLPRGAGDRFSGYAIIGQPFQWGDFLALRRFPVSSIGPGYTSVWHRDPAGRWTVYSTVAPDVSCARYIGRQVAENVVTPINISWTDSVRFRVVVGTAIGWDVTLAPSLTTWLLNTIAATIPERGWQRPAVLRLMGGAATATLGAGRLNLVGVAPNGHRFFAIPQRLWLIESSEAVVHGVSVGPAGPLAAQASLGDLLLPQRGLFAIARTRFEQAVNREGTRGRRAGPCVLQSNPRFITHNERNTP